MFRPSAWSCWPLLVLGTIALAACDRAPIAHTPADLTESPPPTSAISPSPAPPAPTSAAPAPAPTPTLTLDPYEEAIAKATSAVRLGQLAAAPADWQLAADRWQAAITWLRQVPRTHPQAAQVATKIADYQRQQTYAQQQAQRSRHASLAEAPIPPSSPIAPRLPRSIAPRPNEVGTWVPVTPPEGNPASTAIMDNPQTADALPSRFQVPIKRREGLTPVVEVMFNGQYPFEMILDTGASGTVITQAMAQRLGVVPRQTAIVNTATEANVQMPVGIVDSIAVGDRVMRQVPVAIAGPALSIGLLGQDFFSEYDLVIRESVVEFHARSG